jgi:hypothetical protein
MKKRDKQMDKIPIITEKDKTVERRKKIHKFLVSTFIIIGFAILIPMVGRILADVVSYPYSSTIVYFVDNYWSSYSFVLSLIEFALIPLVLKIRDQIFKQGPKGFFFDRPQKYMPSPFTALISIEYLISTWTFANALTRMIDLKPIFSILIVGGFSIVIYYETPKILNINSNGLAPKVLGLSFALIPIVPSIFFAVGTTNPWNILPLMYMLFLGIPCIFMGLVYFIENFRIVKKPVKRPSNDCNAHT